MGAIQSIRHRVRRAFDALRGNQGASTAGGCDETFIAGGYTLCTTVLHAGTRSEGRVGRLLHDGVEVPGGEVGATIDVPTPDGTVRFTYLGEDRPHLWSNSGWSRS